MKSFVSAGIALVSLAALTTSCRQSFDDDQKYEPLSPSDLFADGQSARPLVAGTVPRETPFVRAGLVQDQQNGAWVDAYPLPITRELLELGRERYGIYCSPCHGLLGDGEGLVAQRGFIAVPSLQTERARSRRLGRYFDIITNGLGAMYPYGSRIEPRQRWAIIAYLQALQRSQSVPADSLPESDREKLAEASP